MTGTMHPYLDHPTLLAFAHRGGPESAPENSLAAFRTAVDLGYRYLETDVQVSRDGVLVAFHDDRLERLTDGVGRVGERTWLQLKTLKLANGEPMPLLAELFEAFPQARFNIDPKSDDAAVELGRFLKKAKALDRVCIGSFSAPRLKRLRRDLGEGLCTSATSWEVARMKLAPWSLRPGSIAAQCIQVPPRWKSVDVVDAVFIRLAGQLGLPVHVWTVNDEAEMARLIDLGVKGLMTDQPTALRGLLAQRGQWT